MMNFIALYRGPTVSEARLVAVSSEPGVVGRFIRELAGEADSTDDEAFVWRLWFWTQDPEQIRRIHAGSGLSRQKSTRRRDYLERSIKNAAGFSPASPCRASPCRSSSAPAC